MPHVIGIDLGGTKTAAAVVADDGTLLLSRTAPTPSTLGPRPVLDTAARLVEELRQEAQARGVAVGAVGVGAAGVIDPGRGIVTSATDSIRGWAGTRITDELTLRTGLPSAALNDVHAHALGESWLGAGAGAESVLFVGIGTGVGGGYVLAGECVRGANFTAGHLGHFASPSAYESGAPLACSCGGEGHVEAIASGPAIFSLFQRLGGGPAEDTKGVYRLAAAGHPVASAAMDRGASAAGQAIGGLTNILDPHVVVVGGGLAFAGPLWWDAMERAARKEMLAPVSRVPLVAAQLGESAAILGAARTAAPRVTNP